MKDTLQKYNFGIIKTFVIFITYLVKMQKYFIPILYFDLLVKMATGQGHSYFAVIHKINKNTD
jgi:hypothetical protein